MKHDNMPPCVRKTTIGGQAIIEGISMKGPEVTCVTVRKPDGTLESQKRPTPKPNSRFWKLPVARGAYTLFTAMKDGVSDINYSAQFFEDDSNIEPSRLERWIENHVSSDKLEKLLMGIAMVIGTLLPIALFLVAPTLIVGILPKDAPYFVRSLLEGLVRIVLFLIFMWSVSHMKDIERTFRYHGAEHKTIFCYEAGLPLTVENVRNMPRFHPRCGTSFMIVMMIIPILIFAFVQMDNVWLRMALRLLLLPVVVGIAYECSRWSGRHDGWISRLIRWPGLQMQRLTVFEPDDRMIEVAIHAMQQVIPPDDSDTWK